MNYKKILILSAVIATPMLFADFTYKKVSGSHPGSTGAPGDNTCAKSGCHSGSAVTQNNNTVNQLIFPTLDSSYTPGQTYLVKIKVAKAGIARFGFEIQALADGTNKNVGTWGITQATRTQIVSHAVGSDTRYSVTHKQAGTAATPSSGQNEWQFNWTAPATNEGPITLYYATNCTNNNGASSGDQIYTNTFKLKVNTSISVNEILSENEVNVFYNNNGGYFDLQYALKKDEMVQVLIVDASGREVYSNGVNKPQGINTDKINLTNEINSGIYFVSILAGESKVTKKINVIR